MILVEPFPFIVRQPSAFDALTLDLAHVYYQTIDQLHVRHFKGEDTYGLLVIEGHVLGHGEHKGGLTHCRTGSNDYQVGVLPPGGELVQLLETGRKTAHTILAVRRQLYILHRLLDHRIDLDHILLHVALRDFEESPFGLLHQVVHIYRFVESLLRHL